jgi:selenocysteine-specific elongation factor
MTQNSNSIFNVVVGTAGHIDHGKSSMVRRLTGIDPDRLPEEKNRGLTIDLGFAPLELRNGKRIGIIDVPGHERLIKNMVAGATGIDLVLLVVAADDSVMPQTREHLTIMQILGLRHGIVVVSKIDLIEREMVELVREELSESLEGTFLEDSPVVEISSQTGEGFDVLVDTLNNEVEKIQPREESGVFRMPVQRVFSPKGFGTVVTGIPISGSVEVGATLEISPLGKKGRVRGIQAYKETATHARAGHSAAINISDVDYREVHRGMVVSEPGYFSGSTMFEARLRYLPDNHRPLLHQSDIRLHVGTAEVLGKVFLLDKKTFDPGEEGFVQFRLVEPVVAAPGDRYVLRLHSPMLTIGGGEILDRSTFRLKTGKEYVLDDLRSKHDALGDSEGFVLHHLKAAGFDAVTEKDLALRCALPLDETRELVKSLVDKNLVRPASRAGLFFATQRLDDGAIAAREAAAQFFEKNRRRLLHDKSQLKQQLKCHDVFLEDVLARLRESGDIESIQSGRIRWRDFGPTLTEDEESMSAEIGRVLLEGKFQPPTPPDLAKRNSWAEDTTTDLYDLLDEHGELRKLSDGIYIHRDALEEARVCLREYLLANGEMTASDAKNVLESTRKYSIPLLEQLDKDGFTVRRGDVRHLANKDG